MFSRTHFSPSGPTPIAPPRVIDPHRTQSIAPYSFLYYDTICTPPGTSPSRHRLLHLPGFKENPYPIDKPICINKSTTGCQIPPNLFPYHQTKTTEDVIMWQKLKIFRKNIWPKWITILIVLTLCNGNGTTHLATRLPDHSANTVLTMLVALLIGSSQNRWLGLTASVQKRYWRGGERGVVDQQCLRALVGIVFEGWITGSSCFG